MSRRTAREAAFKLLFQMEIQKDDPKKQIEFFLEQGDFDDNDVDDNDKEFILDVIKGTISDLSEIDKSIEVYLKGWKINRISKVDLAILRLAIYEILNRDDIPTNVSVNEAVEIAKKYSGEESGSFINGILGKFIKDRVVHLEETQG